MRAACKATRDGVVIRVRCQPGAKRSEIQGLLGDALKVRVAAPPVDGKANRALVAFLAKALGVPKRSLSISAGAGGRSKRVRVEGLSPEEAGRRLAKSAGG